MNILIDQMPQAMEISGRVCPINYDFRAGIEFELLVDAGENNAFKLIRPFFSDLQAWPDMAAVFEAVLWFFRCGAEPVEDDGTRKEKGYSYDKDAEVIYSDFWRYYNIDLSSAHLHWWAFKALLMGLPSDSEFKSRIYYRTCDLKGLPKEERARIGKIRKLISLEKRHEKLTLEERNAKMIEYVQKRTNECKGGD